MAKAIDLATLTVAVFLFTLVWATLLFDKWAGAIIFAAGMTAVAVFTFVYKKQRRYRPYHPDRLAAELCVRGDEYLVDLLKKASGNSALECGEDYVRLGDTMWFAAFRFVKLGPADLCARLRRAEKAGAIRAVILTRAADRRAFGVARCFPVKLSVVRTRALFRFLSKRRALPALERFPTGFSPKAFVAAALSRNNLKNYMFSGIVLISVAFLTPLKIYYLVFGSLSLAMALLTLTPLAEGKDDGDGALKRLLPAPEEYVRETEQNTAHGDDANGNDNIFDDKTCGNNGVVRGNSGEENGSDGNSHGNDNGGDGDNSRDDKDGGNDTPGGKDTTDGNGR